MHSVWKEWDTTGIDICNEENPTVSQEVSRKFVKEGHMFDEASLCLLSVKQMWKIVITKQKLTQLFLPKLTVTFPENSSEKERFPL